MGSTQPLGPSEPGFNTTYGTISTIKFIPASSIHMPAPGNMIGNQFKIGDLVIYRNESREELICSIKALAIIDKINIISLPDGSESTVSSSKLEK